MKVEAILHCVAVAMDESDADAADAPSFQDALAGARDLLNRTLDELDSVQVRPLLRSAALDTTHTVEESRAEYVH